MRSIQTLHNRIGLVLFLSILAFANCSSSVPSNAALLSWDANTEPDLAGYEIHYGTEPGKYTKTEYVGLTDTPETPQHLVSNLTSDVRYYFTVITYDSSGNTSVGAREVFKDIR